MAAANAAGHARMLYLTSHNVLGEVTAEPGRPIAALAIAPRDDGLIALADNRAWRWGFDPQNPEVTLGSLFTRVWYEGYTGPIHKWEAPSGADAFEPKFGMAPLVFGTLKATFYSLLFGVPLALLAAIHTSEFMNPGTRAAVKPAIEMMASLPSVVLGFLAGLVFAELVEPVLATVLACFLTVPFAFVLGARVIQFLPPRAATLLTHYRFALFLFTLPVGLAASLIVGPVLEWIFFGGDLRAWLSDRSQSALGGWMFFFFPLGLLATSFAMGAWFNPWLCRVTADWVRHRVAATDLIRFLVGCTLAFLLAVACSGLMTALGFDARNVYLGTYDPKNSLIVCFVMGFAIIPIIYTIAEDALSSVPAYLRSGPLATGATPWQTATRIVIPTAMSGLFSAVMVGMGRAIGETMIVLMAAGNTAVMDWNVFNGFRTLSANLAVELPDAVRGGTHYRTLFLGALVLFSLTFVLNTVAEVIRLRFRRRAYQL